MLAADLVMPRQEDCELQSCVSLGYRARPVKENQTHISCCSITVVKHYDQSNSGNKEEGFGVGPYGSKGVRILCSRKSRQHLAGMGTRKGC